MNDWFCLERPGTSEHRTTAASEREPLARTCNGRKVFKGRTLFRDVVGSMTECFGETICGSVWMEFWVQSREWLRARQKQGDGRLKRHLQLFPLSMRGGPLIVISIDKKQGQAQKSGLKRRKVQRARLKKKKTGKKRLFCFMIARAELVLDSGMLQTRLHSPD